PAGRGIATPHDLCAAGGGGPARALKGHDRPPPRRRIRGTVVVPRIAIVCGASVPPVGRPHVERSVLSEVLHPPVVPVVDGLVEQRCVEAPPRRRAEVEL